MVATYVFLAFSVVAVVSGLIHWMLAPRFAPGFWRIHAHIAGWVLSVIGWAGIWLALLVLNGIIHV